MNWAMSRICPQYAFAPFLDDGVAEEQQDKTEDVPPDLKEVPDGGGLRERGVWHHEQ